jgi:hypothetical protein
MATLEMKQRTIGRVRNGLKIELSVFSRQENLQGNEQQRAHQYELHNPVDAGSVSIFNS